MSEDVAEEIAFVIGMLRERGYRGTARTLEEVYFQYTTTTSEKAGEVLRAIEWILSGEKLPSDIETRLLGIESDLRCLLERANNPWPWNMLKRLRRMFGRQ